MLHEGYANAKSDFDNRRIVELISEMGTMEQAIKKNLPQAAKTLDKESLDDIQSAVTHAKSTIDAGASAADKDAVQKTRDALEQASLPLAAILMDSVVKKAVSGKQLGEL